MENLMALRWCNRMTLPVADHRVMKVPFVGHALKDLGSWSQLVLNARTAVPSSDSIYFWYNSGRLLCWRLQSGVLWAQGLTWRRWTSIFTAPCPQSLEPSLTIMQVGLRTNPNIHKPFRKGLFFMTAMAGASVLPCGCGSSYYVVHRLLRNCDQSIQSTGHLMEEAVILAISSLLTEE